MTGCDSVVFEPVTSRQSASRISRIGFVIAPLPNAMPSPVTELLWHRRAQWSTLFVPSEARTSFWNR
jgi:hypothetical protein